MWAGGEGAPARAPPEDAGRRPARLGARARSSTRSRTHPRALASAPAASRGRGRRRPVELLEAVSRDQEVDLGDKLPHKHTFPLAPKLTSDLVASRVDHDSIALQQRGFCIVTLTPSGVDLRFGRVGQKQHWVEQSRTNTLPSRLLWGASSQADPYRFSLAGFHGRHLRKDKRSLRGPKQLSAGVPACRVIEL